MAFRSAKLASTQDLNMKRIEEKVRKAKTEKKIFILMGKYEAVRKGLLDRGWLEKVFENQMMYIPPSSERLLIASFLRNSDFNFIWQAKSRPIKTDEAKKHLVNSVIRQRIYDFTTKDGLKNCIDSFPWNCIDGVTELNFYPRTYILNDKSAKDDFFEDYRQTAFISFIKFLNSVEKFTELFSVAGNVPLDTIDFTIQKIELLMKIQDHEDIDMSRIFDACAKYPKDQRKVLNYIHHMTNGKRKFQLADDLVIEKYKNDIKNCAEEIEYRWPHLQYDGFTNTWIFKPIGSSSGNGIFMENNFQTIRETLAINAYKTFLVQKYIERPMLIHNKKFDIRIYLLTSIQDGFVNIWLYKDCYVKFATRNFKLSDLHKSIHVTNYAVQKHYMNSQDAVPFAKENMWTLRQLIDYFATIEQPRLWEAKIFPAIKKILLAVIIPSLEITKIENFNFELNGADFMITYDYETTLIEVNSVPALFFSNVVVEMITNKLLDDVIKVVIDYQKDPTAYTGDFELIYTQEMPKQENFADLTVVGRKIKHSINSNGSINKPIIDVKMNTKTLEAYRKINDRYVYFQRV